MCLIYRMNVNAMGVKPVNNSTKKNKNVFNTIKNAFGMGNSAEDVGQTGGVAPVNYRYPANMQQPSEAIMEWATTAEAPTPLSGMRNVAHGGRRRHTRKHKSHRRTRKHKSHCHTRSSKKHHRKHTHKRRR